MASRARTTTTTAFQLSPSNQNTLAPRTLSTATGPRIQESFGGGNACSTTAVNASQISASSGTLRTISTYARAVLRRMKFCDRRATPISVPNTVASTMPVIARRSVLKKPSRMASFVGCEGRNELDGIGKPAGWSRYA